ncbi:hypothetical protein DPMN_118115 [Dreissena polymorpha]|uniref:Uncharacterized protein n=1 Tax=Dreissena polymorpha TaxID=45954 RepID=A0A9D4GGS5_DREPO|nr:hypothetical protein DPMN_118115 [Dreissena polymorpha]
MPTRWKVKAETKMTGEDKTISTVEPTIGPPGRKVNADALMTCEDETCPTVERPGKR